MRTTKQLKLKSVLLALVIAFGSGCRIQQAFNQGYEEGARDANEAYLKMHLENMREGIKKYTQETGKPPEALHKLVDTGYLPMVPTDPVTGKIDWVVVYTECLPSANCVRGVKDVHSAANEVSSLGNRYSEW